MIAYRDIAKEIEDIIKTIEEVEYTEEHFREVAVRLDAILGEVKERNSNTCGKEVERRKNSKRAEMLHNVSNKLSYARKRNDNELIKKCIEEREYIKKSIFD